MIANHKPTRRAATFAALTLTLILLALTFTRAADSAVSPSGLGAPADTPAPDKAKRERTVKVLEAELHRIDALIKDKQAELDKMRTNLGISDAEAPGLGTASPETLQKLQTLCLEARADATRMETFRRYLTNLSRIELKKAVATATPDPQLSDLLTQLHRTEQKLASLQETHGPEHPEMKTARRVVEQINRHIEDRLDGILQGLEAKAEAERARADQLQKDMDARTQREIAQAIARRPFFKARRELENLETLRERLQFRLFQEKIDAAIEKGP